MESLHRSLSYIYSFLSNNSDFFIAFTAIIALIVTIITLIFTMYTWKQKIKGDRPYLAIEKANSQQKGKRIVFHVKNCGVRPAKNISSKISIVKDKPENKPYEPQEDCIINELPSKMMFELATLINTQDKASTFYIKLTINYEDSNFEKEHLKNEFYYKLDLNRIAEEGSEMPPLEIVSCEEVEKMKNDC